MKYNVRSSAIRQRLPDLRRYRGRFGLDLFPTGNDFGDQERMPLPDLERDNNPDL